MAITLDAVLGNGNGTGSTTTITTTSAVATDARIIVLIGRFSGTGTTVSTVTAGAINLARDHSLLNVNLRIEMWSAAAPSGLASSSTITVTHSGACDCIIGSASYLGIDTTGTVVATNAAAAATAAWASGSVAGNAGDALMGGAFVDSGSVSSSTPGGAAVERIDNNVPGQSETLVLQDILSISGATDLTGTWNAAATHIAIGVAYKAAAGGAVGSGVMRTFNPIPFL